MDEEEITQWASGLTPEGSPGTRTQQMREYLGDEGYEKVIARQDALADGYLQRQALINSLLSEVAVFGALFGLIALVAAIAVVAHIIFT